MDLELLATDPLAFIEALTVPTSSGPRRFGSVMADFQRDAFEALAPSLLALAEGRTPPIPRAWIERTKGGSKDSDLACCLLWLLVFSPRSLRCQIAAGDQSQADEIRLIFKSLIALPGELNEIVASLLEVQADRIVNKATDSTAQILTRDAAGSHGARPDVLIVNELSHISDEEFAQTLRDNSDKVQGLVVIASNAGFLPSWQDRWKQIALNSHRWYVQEIKQPAPWISADDLAESELRNPRSRFRRLWYGEWASGGGDAIDGLLIEAACTLDGPTFAPKPGYSYYGGCDLGLKKDSASVVVVGKHIGHSIAEPPPEVPDQSPLRDILGNLFPGEYKPRDLEPQLQWVPGDGSLHVAQVLVVRPPSGGQIELTAIEEAIAAIHRTFNLAAVFVDQWQAALLCQRLRMAGVPAAGIDPTGPQLREQAQVVLDLFTEHRLKTYRDPALLADLRALRLIEKSYGVRLSAARSSDGEGTAHADSASAFALAALAAHRGTVTAPVTNFGAPLLTWP